MRVRSEALWKYLNDTGTLNGSDEDIVKAKAEYRRIYKREYKRKQHLPKKELRPSFTLREYQEIKVRAYEVGLKPTGYIKQTVLASLESKQLIPHRERLQNILQILSMTAIASERNDTVILAKQVLEAEKLLLEYMRNNDSQNPVET